jgi:carboxyl-terminal processing protease
MLHARTPPVVSRARRLAIAPAAALLVLLLAAGQARGLPGRPDAAFGLAATRVVELLETRHIDAAPLDDARSGLLFDGFLDALDPSRLHFLESDVEDFAASRNILDDRLRAGDLGFFADVFARFALRVDERLADVRALVAEPMDLDLDEYIQADRRQAPRPRSSGEVTDLWRKSVKLEVLERLAAGASIEAALREVLARHEERARMVRATTTSQLVETCLTSLGRTYDAHTAYLSPQSVEEFDIAMRLELDGIGVALEMAGGEIVVRELVKGGAAERDGRLSPGDRIVAVGEGETGEIVDATAEGLARVVRRIRGPRGTPVRVDVLHEDGAPETIVLRRARIELTDRAARGEVIRRGTVGGQKPLVAGVIELQSFYRDLASPENGAKSPTILPGSPRSSARDLRALLEGFHREPVDVVVLDLRRNSGGALAEAVDVTGLFIDTGPVVQVKGPGDELRVESDTDPGAVWDGPLVVLTSRFTASAAEIFAAAIQDHGRGLVVGDRSTHGKATVQTLVPLGTGGAGVSPDAPGTLKLTVSQFYRPLGQSTHGLGVVPDIELPSLSSHAPGEAEIASRVRADRIAALPLEPRGLAPREVVAELGRLSAARSAASGELLRVREEIARHLESRSRGWIPLAREKYMAAMAPTAVAAPAVQSPALRADPRQHRALSPRKIEVDAYLSEVLEIAADYAAALRGNR